MKKEEEYRLVSIARQKVFTFLANMMVSINHDTQKYAIETMEFVWSVEPKIEKKVAQKYKDYMDVILTAKLIISHIKSYYDTIEGKTILKNDVSNPKFLKYKDALTDLMIINKRLYEIFAYTIMLTPFKDYTIPQEYIARAERQYKRFEPKEEQYQKHVIEEDEYED